MPPVPDRSFHFMFQTDHGRIDRTAWWRGTLPLAGIVAVMSGVWMLLRPYARHDLATTPFLAVPTLLAFVYLGLFSFGLILVGVCEYNLSAKRFRDRGRAGALAAILPLAILGAGALIWFIPQSFGEVPDWAGPFGLAALAAVVAWNVWDLGFGESRPPAP